MAGLQKKNDVYHCQFRWLGTKYTFKVGAVPRQQAEARAGAVDHLLHKLKMGYVSLPDGCDVRTFVLYDGDPPRPQTAGPAEAGRKATLARLRDSYLAAAGHSLEANTVLLLQIHFRHLVTTLGARQPVDDIRVADLQRHIDRRAGSVQPGTVRKELVTLRTAMGWAKASGLTRTDYPGWKALRFPKGKERPPFMTREEIERGGEGAWDCLYLRPGEVRELLEYIKSRAAQPWVYPMACFAAHTGARRSEMLRAKRADIDLDNAVATVREKKRVKGSTSTRRVPLSGFLAGVLREHVSRAEGPWLFSQGEVARSKKDREGRVAVTKDEAHDHLKRVLSGGEWSVVRGWHVLRHSFISACVLKGVDQRVLDKWVGHTSSIRERYTHLSPSDTRGAIEGVLG